MLEITCPGASHSKGMTDCLCPVEWHSSLYSPLCFSLICLQTITGHEYPEFVKIVEVGPRDGLQNEKVHTVISATNLIYIYMHPCFVYYT